MKSTSKILMTLTLLWLTVLMCLGGWWIFLMVNFDKMFTHLDKIRFSKMLFWEGSAFITLLILICVSLMIFYIKDYMKTKALQDFFASLTHELKTPLASIKLQGEVIGEILENRNEPNLKNLLNRLNEDTLKLETQMDKILQLSRIEQGGNLNLTTVKLIPFIKKIHKQWKKDLELNLQSSDDNIIVLADEFALELILKNLFENTKNHSQSTKIDIKILTGQYFCEINYNDHGIFSGDKKKLSQLFYKHNSTKGSGIGLYLSKKLTEKMNGKFTINYIPNLNFSLKLHSTEDKNA